MNFPLELARNLAEEICANAADVCERIEIGGSIRREKQFVKDIEIVAIPKWHEEVEEGNLFDVKTIRKNLLYERLKDDCFLRWIKPGTNEIIDAEIKPDGKYWRGILNIGLKVDFFLCSKSNWGIIFPVRTGPHEFSKALMIHVRKYGCRVEGGHIWRGEEKLETPDERELFARFNLQYIKPKYRIDASSLKALKAKGA